MARRRRWLRQPLSWKRGGAVALAVLVVVAAAALVLDANAGAETEPVIEYVEARGREPARLIEEAGRAARVVLLSDIHEVAATKRVAASAIRALAEGPGLDAVVLEVPSSEQPYIDAYLSRASEDATVLLSRPAAVQERYGLSRAYLDIYRAVWEMNQAMGAARRIRIIAADLPDWPPPDGSAAADIAGLYARRSEHMLARLDDEILSIFVDGYLALKRTHGQARFAGGEPVRIEWLGEMLRRRASHDVRTLLIDAGGAAAGGSRLPGYHGTELLRPLRRELGDDAAVRVGDPFRAITDPVLETAIPGLRIEIQPAGYTLSDVADGYIFLRSGS
jgi:hypothetical protein